MQFLKLTPLQSRFAASFIASAFLVLLYFTLTNPKFADAAELDSLIPSDHNHPILYDYEQLFSESLDNDEDKVHDSPYEPEFDSVDRGIIGRAAAGVTSLANNDAQQLNIEIGDIQYWVFPKDALAGNLSAATPGLPSVVERRSEHVPAHAELRKRQDDTDDVTIPGGSRTLYITMNTCLQPSANSSDGSVIPPQLEVYVSQTLEEPGPSSSSSDQTKVNVTGGFATLTLDADDDVYIAVVAPNTTDFSGIWNYELACSIDGPFHSLDSEDNLYFVDSDNHAALLYTGNLTQADENSTLYQEWMNMTPPFSMFAHNQNNSAILGIQNSYCGLKNYANVFATYSDNNAGEILMTNRGLGSKPKEQFVIRDINASSTYYGILAMTGNSTASGNGVVGGGGKVWQVMNFTTKQENNCALLYNLPFCSEVAYAVPSSPNQTVDSLISLYDTYASNYWTAFNYSLQQIPCNATNTAQYSLARNCDDCASAYKTWLCAVTIPRCEDYSSIAPYLLPRNTAQAFPNGTHLTFSTTTGLNSQPLGSSDGPGFSFPGSASNESLLYSVSTNSSRNPMIDTDIKPGPYKEVLPCKDLCYDLVQSCPAALGFSCPLPGKGLEVNYGERSKTGDVTCSFLGAAYDLSAGERVRGLGWRGVVGVGGLVGVVLVLF